MKALVCGSRNWTNPDQIKYVIDSLPTESTVIVGGALGADFIAESLAEKRRDLKVKVFLAQWDLHGKRAGPIRNIEMLDQEPDVVYAFPLEESKGTSHTIREARKRGIKTIVYGENNVNA